MKLTNTIRDSFIRAVMNDVPKIDYDEQIRSILTKDSAAHLPAKVRPLWKDEATRSYVSTFWFHRSGWISATLPGVSGTYKPTSEVEAEIECLMKAKEAQRHLHNDLQQKAKAAAYSVTTRKALVELIPEFEKYLPADEAAAIKTLPVVANVVSSFVKAGWPKDAKKKVAA